MHWELYILHSVSQFLDLKYCRAGISGLLKIKYLDFINKRFYLCGRNQMKSGGGCFVFFLTKCLNAPLVLQMTEVV